MIFSSLPDIRTADRRCISLSSLRQAILNSALAGILLLCLSCGKPMSDEPGSVKFSAFSQQITSSTATLNLTANQQTSVPVVIQNTSKDTWYSSGAFPINVSYKWIKDNQVLPIEGLRTHIPQAAMKPGDSAKVDVSVLAPPKAGNYELNITLLQEGVAWFSLSGATPLRISCIVR